MTINKQALDSQLILDEGLRLQAYKDTRGCLTVGVGRNLDTNPLSQTEIAVCGSDGRTSPITHDAAIFLLHNDEVTAMDSLSDHLPWWVNCDDARARVLIGLCFNMGVHKLVTFDQFLTLIRDGAYDDAADDLAGTLWYREVGERGPRYVSMVRTGKDALA